MLNSVQPNASNYFLGGKHIKAPYTLLDQGDSFKCLVSVQNCSRTSNRRTRPRSATAFVTLYAKDGLIL